MSLPVTSHFLSSSLTTVIAASTTAAAESAASIGVFELLDSGPLSTVVNCYRRLL